MPIGDSLLGNPDFVIFCYMSTYRPTDGLPGDCQERELAQVAQAVELIRAGGVVAYPTDTFYGLGADPFNEEAVINLLRAKGRSPSNPVPLLLMDLDDCLMVATEFPIEARRLAERYWPGQLTIVLPAREEVPSSVTGGTGTVGVRVPDHPVPLAIVKGLGRPITGTSANTSGLHPHQTAQGVKTDLGEVVELIILGNCGLVNLPSTVLDFSQSPPRLLREGAIKVHELTSISPGII